MEGRSRRRGTMLGGLKRAWVWLRPRIWVMRVLEPLESERLGEHVLEKAARISKSSQGSDPGSGASGQELEDWVKYRFQGPLIASAEAGPDYGKAFTALSVLTIAAGLASSVIASATGQPSKVAIGALGLAVGLLTAINRIWNPAQRSVARYQAAYALRREGWDFVNGRGRYGKLDADKRLGAFIDEVGRIHREVESLDETASSAHAAG
jgi:hypothetical protein